VKRCLSFPAILLLACAWSSTLTGCSLPSVTAEQRTYALVAGVNAVSRDIVADNFLPGIADYAKLQDPLLYPNLWETNFPYAYAPYTVTAMDAANPAAVNLTIADNQGPLGSWGGPKDVLLVMRRVGNDWFVVEMQMPPGTVIVQ
jgi:hypothetical protein